MPRTEPANYGVICSPEELIRTDGSIHCLTRGQSIGLTLIAESGFVSLLAVLFVFTIIASNAIRHIRLSPSGRWRLIQEPMDIFMLSLFFADFTQALGAILDIKWINEGKVVTGSFCTAQGVIQQLGETGVAITTLVIALYTFVGVWWRKGAGATLIAKIITVAVWLFILLITAIGNAVHANKGSPYQAPTPYWCWIGSSHLSLRIVGEYIWLWLTLVVSVLVYVPLYFWSRGNITFYNDSWWGFSIHKRRPEQSLEPEFLAIRKTSLSLIAYPVVYSILILPVSVVRWVGFVQEGGGKTTHIPSSATLFVVALYGFSGFANVVLFMVTRPNSMLFGKSRELEAHGDGRAPSRLSDDRLAEHSTRRHPSKEPVTVDAMGFGLGRLPSRSEEGR